MREILFKAKRLDNGEWVKGSHILVDDIHYILPSGAHLRDIVEVDPSTICEYTNIDVRREAWPQPEKHKIFTSDVLGEWTEDEDGNEYIGFFGIVTYWDDEGRYVLADENGLCNDWTLEDVAQPENWPNLIHCGNIHDREGGQHEGNE